MSRVAVPLLVAALTGVLPTAATGCELVLVHPRGGAEWRRLPLATPVLVLSFVHSVLGTRVEDRYRWRGGAWHLVEERFEGEGYGLPHLALPGERLQRDGLRGWVLATDRLVDPLVVRPVSGMTLQAAGHAPILLSAFGASAVELRTAGCRGADG